MISRAIERVKRNFLAVSAKQNPSALDFCTGFVMLSGQSRLVQDRTKATDQSASVRRIVLSSRTVNATPLKHSAYAEGKAAVAQAGRAPVPIARIEIHETVARILDPLPRGKLLDVPAGEGALSARLSQAGFHVSACDLYPEIFRLPDVEVRRGDLSGVLPYPDSEFQYITCLEGLEHIENPHQAIREFARVLAPGGHLLISVPNILNIEERIKWLLSGYTSHFKPISEEHLRMRHEQWGEKEEVVLHINPIAYTELRYVLEKYGFEDRKSTRLNSSHRL